MPVQSAKITGVSIKLGNREIHQVHCPSCERLQWHNQGVTDCIFCDAQFSVRTFQLIKNENPAILPEEEEEE